MDLLPSEGLGQGSDACSSLPREAEDLGAQQFLRSQAETSGPGASPPRGLCPASVSQASPPQRGMREFSGWTCPGQTSRNDQVRKHAGGRQGWPPQVEGCTPGGATGREEERKGRANGAGLLGCLERGAPCSGRQSVPTAQRKPTSSSQGGIHPLPGPHTWALSPRGAQWRS